MAAPSQLSFGSVVIYDDQVLGVGAYGKVCKAKYGQLPCAAKLLHDTMFEGGDPGIFKFAERFEQECQFLSMIKHPNVVQYLGTCRIPLSQRLVLLMELMDESLTRILERFIDSLPYHIQLNICHDVALALSYLHSNAIIHRDLSSNNILLIGEGSRAKVTDFGMSKLMDMNPRMTPLTVCPGATVYMPPEALTTPPHYSSKLDCFSHGVLTIQILTRNFPKPGDAHQAVEDPNYPTGPIILPVPETERRKEDIDLIEPGHPLLPLALDCLHNRSTERPSADEVCERLATLKREERYTHSVEQTRDQTSLLQILRRELVLKDEVIQQQRASHDREIREQASLIETLRGELAQNDQVIQQERAFHEHETKEQASLIQTLRKELVLKDEVMQQQRASHNHEIREQASLVQTLREELKQKDQAIQQEDCETREQASLIQTLREELVLKDEVIQQQRETHNHEIREQASLVQTLREELKQKDQAIQQEKVSHDCETREQASLIQTLREELDEVIQQQRAFHDHEIREHTLLIQTLRKELVQKEQVIQQQRESHDHETRKQASLIQTLQGELLQKDQVIQQEREDCETLKQTSQTPQKELVQKDQVIQQESASHNREAREQASLIQTPRKEFEQQLILKSECQETHHAVQLQKERDEHHESLQESKTATGATPELKAVKSTVITKWRKGEPLPAQFYTARGSSLVDGNTAYFSCGYSIYLFTILDSHWRKLRSCPHRLFAMAVIGDKLTIIGGMPLTNALLSFDMGNWKTIFPPMPTKRSSPAAVTTPTHLVVAGGCTGLIFYTDVVEVLDTHSLQWSRARHLPMNSPFPQMTLYGKHIYLANDAAVISCSTEELLKSCKHKRGDGGPMWTRLADIPVWYGASLVSVREHVLAIGGQKDVSETSATPSIHCYHQVTNSWSVVGELPTPLSSAPAVVLPSEKLIVVGGVKRNGECSNTLYITTCVPIFSF